MESILINSVHNSLQNFMYRNAIFLSERLCAEFPSEANVQLLAGCYLHNKQAYSAYHILKGTQMDQSRYIFALSCFEMDLLREAESVLCPANDPGAEIPNGAAGHYLLGLIYRYTDRSNSAVHHLKQALLIDPLLWAAYEELCILGHAEEANAVFGEAAAICIQQRHLNYDVPQQVQASREECNPDSARNIGFDEVSPRQLKHLPCNNVRDIPGNYHRANLSGGASIPPANAVSSKLSFYTTPSPIVTQQSCAGPPPLCRNMANPIIATVEDCPRSTVNSTMQAPRKKYVAEGKLRKISGRLFSDSGPRRSSRLAGEAGSYTSMNSTMLGGNAKGNSTKYLGCSKLSSVTLGSATRKGQSWANESLDEGMRPEVLEDSRSNIEVTDLYYLHSYVDTKSLDHGAAMSLNGSKSISGISDILSLFRILGEGYRLSCLYRCQDALDVFLKLSQKQYNTAWVLSQVGKAYFELVDYLEADQAFTLARRVSPYSLEGMDIYSTVLYLLKDDMKLSYLAQELISTDRLAPQTWCAMGNCYSLQKDHETALKNFQRAVQLNSKFTYAYTLCGHEYVSLEDYENGIKFYHNALRIDVRHYNSWHGLGMIYLRQERFEFAEHHFRKAFQINSRSSVIMSYLGTALHALQRTMESLEMMDKAMLADKKNPLPMYQKASILMSLEHFDEALELLEELKEYAPRETSIYALMGRIYKRRNMHDKAMLYFGLALDLKPSAADVATIKAAIEKLHVPDELEDM